MTKEHDKIAVRLASILVKLNAGERFTINELACEYNVSERTIQRDLYERFAYLPICKEQGVYFLDSYALGKLSFEDIKNFAMLSGIQSLFPSLSQDFISDLLNSKLNTPYLIKNQGHENIAHRHGWFETISEAIIKYQNVMFNYHEKPRTVQPYKLINNNGIWYLLADEDGKLKNFTFSKISDLQINTFSVFTPNPLFVEKIAKNDTNWFSDVSIEVVLSIDASIQEYFLRKELFANKTIISQTPETLILSTHISYDEEILGIVKYWLPYVRILSPQPLQEKLKNILHTYLEMTYPDISQ